VKETEFSVVGTFTGLGKHEIWHTNYLTIIDGHV
jgi:hypothetical protein